MFGQPWKIQSQAQSSILHHEIHHFASSEFDCSIDDVYLPEIAWISTANMPYVSVQQQAAGG